MAQRKDTTARDIKRKLDMVKKYINQLQDLGVESCFAYTSRRTGGIFAYVHSTLQGAFIRRIADSEQCLLHLQCKESSYLLPRLPVLLSKMNAPTIKMVLTNITRDLGLSFNGPPPSWWSHLLPYRAP